MSSRKLRNSIVKSVALLVALIFGLVLYNKVTTTDMIENMMNVFDEKDNSSGFSVKEKYTEEQRDSIYQKIKGFWECNEINKKGFSYKGRLEITPVGYVWQVEDIECELPSGETTKITHVLNGFIYPSSAGGEGDNTISIVFRNLTQLWIQDGDSCKVTKYYGIGGGSGGQTMLDKMDVVVSDFKDEPMELDLSNGLLALFKRSYKRYGNSDVATFFPKGIIDYVYNLSGTDVNIEKRQYDVKKGQITINKDGASKIALDPFSLSECKECKTVSDFLRVSIINDIKTNKSSKRNNDDIIKIVKDFYEPLSMDNALDYTLYQNDKKNVFVKIRFEITPKGDVNKANVNIGVNNIGKKVVENTMIKEIEKWKFAEVESADPFKVEYADTLRY